MLWEVIYFRFLFCAVFSSLSIPPPELTAGGENLAPPAEEVGCILSLALRCSAPSVRSVGWAESRLARVVLVNVRRLFCRSCGVCLLSCLYSWRVLACKSAFLAYVAFLIVGSLRYRHYGLRLWRNMLLRMIRTTWLFIFPRSPAATVSCWAVSRSRDYGEHFGRILPSR